MLLVKYFALLIHCCAVEFRRQKENEDCNSIIGSGAILVKMCTVQDRTLDIIFVYSFFGQDSESVSRRVH